MATAPYIAALAVASTALAVVVFFVKPRTSTDDGRQARKLGLRSVLDYEAYALQYGNALVKGYYGYTSGEGQTLRECRQALARVRFVPRAMQGLAPVTATKIFNKTLSLPLFIAPTALHRCAHPNGEVAMARGAGGAGVGYCYNYFLSSKPLSDVVKAARETKAVLWLHLYLFEERELVEFALEECLGSEYASAFSAVVVTVDHPHNRVRDSVVPAFVREWRTVFGDDEAPYMPNIARAAGIKALAPKELFTSLLSGARTPGNNDGSLFVFFVSRNRYKGTDRAVQDVERP